jgi:hypothetical protein
MITWDSKDPDEVRDYTYDWSDAGDRSLETGETLLTSVFAVVDGDVVIDDDDFADTGLVTVWLSAGTVDTICTIRNRVTTSGGRTYDQTAKLRIRSH